LVAFSNTANTHYFGLELFNNKDSILNHIYAFGSDNFRGSGKFDVGIKHVVENIEENGKNNMRNYIILFSDGLLLTTNKRELKKLTSKFMNDKDMRVFALICNNENTIKNTLTIQSLKEYVETYNGRFIIYNSENYKKVIDNIVF
jgi:hypothetical protein